MTFNNNDIDYLSKQTKLGRKNLKLLLEEDSELLLKSIADIPSIQTLVTTSFPLFVKLSILRVKASHKYSSEEQDYVTHSITFVYPTVFKESHYFIDKKKIGEREAQQYLVMAGLFPEFLISLSKRRAAPDITFYMELASVGFKSVNNEISGHVFDWVNILNQMRDKDWFIFSS